MGSVLTFPARPFPRVAENAAKAEAFMASPRGRFVDACGGLASLLYAHATDSAIFAYRAGFQREDLVPDPVQLAAAFGFIAGIPTCDKQAAPLRRQALQALVDIACPTNDEPECA